MNSAIFETPNESFMNWNRIAIWTTLAALLGTLLAVFSHLFHVVPPSLGPVIGISITFVCGGLNARSAANRLAAAKGGALVGGIGTLLATSAGFALGGNSLALVAGASCVGVIAGALGGFVSPFGRLHW